MARRARAAKRRERPGKPGADVEWVGGRFAPPIFFEEEGEPDRAQVGLWLELPEGFIVGQELAGSEGAEEVLGRALTAALERPLVGSPRRPARIRVADASLAAQARAIVGGEIPIRVAPTPELDEALESMVEAITSESVEPSYLEDGRIPEETIAAFFGAAEFLYTVAPWRVATDDQVARVDIPELGIDGACLSIIGELGENLGFVMFSSLADFDAFTSLELETLTGPVDLGAGYLALSFDRGAELPDRMRREIAQHGWPVAAAEAHPWLVRVDRDGVPRPSSELDFRIATACARALACFFLRNPGSFGPDDVTPACESFSDDIGPTVRLTAPYEAFPLFDVADERAPAPASAAAKRPGRNDPCHCGSGRKYKKCHLQEDERARGSESAAAGLHALDQRLVADITAFAFARFGIEARGWVEDFDDPAEVFALGVPWAAYHFEIQGRPAVDWFLEEARPRPDSDERRWLEAQRASWLSVWEVTDVRPGEGLTVRDLLTEQERRVDEKLATESLVKRDGILARVVELDGICVLAGMHPQPLPPPEAAKIVRRARGRLRRKRAVPPDRLRDEKLGRYLIRRWEEAVADLERRWSQPLELRNTDGDHLVLTTDHFAITRGAREDVAARIAALDGVMAPEPDEEDPSFRFLGDPTSDRPSTPGATLLGSLRIAGDRIRIETNSIARADALRQRVEETCGDRVRHRTREHSDPLSEPNQRDAPDAPIEATPPEFQQLTLQFKRSHYAGWIDESLPALGGKSPRQALRSRAGRDAVDVLLKDMENHEERLPPGERFDFSELRRRLKLDG